MCHFLLSLTFFCNSVLECPFPSFVHKNINFLYVPRALMSEEGRETMRNKPPNQPHPQALCRHGSSSTRSPTWSSRLHTVTHSDAPASVHCCLVSFFLLVFSAVLQLFSQLIWNFHNCSLAPPYWVANTLLWTGFQATSLTTQNLSVNILFEAEITSSQFCGSMSLSWENLFCPQCCPWPKCSRHHGMQPR